jgi:hypothetical protein
MYTAKNIGEVLSFFGTDTPKIVVQPLPSGDVSYNGTIGFVYISNELNIAVDVDLPLKPTDKVAYLKSLGYSTLLTEPISAYRGIPYNPTEYKNKVDYNLAGNLFSTDEYPPKQAQLLF